jgi:hypothetical protein
LKKGKMIDHRALQAEIQEALNGWWRITPPGDHAKVIPFLRIVGSLKEWTTAVITDREFCRALRKAAAEVQRGY